MQENQHFHMQSLEAMHQSHLLDNLGYQKLFHLEYGSIEQNKINIYINGDIKCVY